MQQSVGVLMGVGAEKNDMTMSMASADADAVGGQRNSCCHRGRCKAQCAARLLWGWAAAKGEDDNAANRQRLRSDPNRVC